MRIIKKNNRQNKLKWKLLRKITNKINRTDSKIQFQKCMIKAENSMVNLEKKKNSVTKLKKEEKFYGKIRKGRKVQWQNL